MGRLLFIEKVIETVSILPVIAANDNAFEIDSTASMDEALNLLKSNRYDLIYINLDFLDMRIMPIFEALIGKSFLGRIIFSGDYKNPKIVKKIGFFKSLDVLIKPFDNNWFKSAIIDNLKQGKSIGNDSEIILSQQFIFKLIYYEKGEIAFKLNLDGDKGTIVFENGIIVHAKYGNFEAEAAVESIINTKVPPSKKDIKITTPGFFMKKHCQVDLIEVIERRDSQNTAPAPEPEADPLPATTEPSPAAEPAVEIKSPLINYMSDCLAEYQIDEPQALILNTIDEMGFTIDTLPQNEEIVLIEYVSKKIPDESNVLDFKKKVVNYLINRDKQ